MLWPRAIGELQCYVFCNWSSILTWYVAVRVNDLISVYTILCVVRILRIASNRCSTVFSMKWYVSLINYT